MNIIIGSELFAPKDIAKIEEKKTALFVCDTCLKNIDGGWINQSVAVFWNKDPANIPVGGSAYFGLFHRWQAPDFNSGILMITNAISAVENAIVGLMAENGDVIYSRYRHDYRGSPDGSVWIDGGRDYTRYGYRRAITTGGELIELEIVNGVLRAVSEREVRNPTPPPALQRSGG